MYGEAIWSSGKRIDTIFNSLRNNIRREAGYQIIKRTLTELPIDTPGGWFAVQQMLNCLVKDELFSKSC